MFTLYTKYSHIRRKSRIVFFFVGGGVGVVLGVVEKIYFSTIFSDDFFFL